jgi:hypothetical protein
MALAAGSVLLVIVIGLFIARAEVAHDETTCPFQEVGRRSVEAGVSVLEQRRRCQEGLEERRWLLLRAGQPPRELGRRRLDRRFYSQDRYRWSVSMSDSGVRIDIKNDGVEGASFREKAPPPPSR